MAYSGGIITAPVDVRDPYYVLGVGQYNGLWDVSYICTNDYINRYSYAKPINYNSHLERTQTDLDYYNSLAHIRYKVGNKLPDSYIYPYNKPILGSSWMRITDFINYNHYEYPELCDISAIPNVWDYDNHRGYINIIEGNFNRNLMIIFPRGANQQGSSYYNNSILIIATKGSESVYFVLEGIFMNELRFLISLPYSDMEIVDKFIALNIESYSCTAIAILIPEGHPSYSKGFHFVDNKTPEYIIHPQVSAGGKDYYPFKSNFKITNPRPRIYWTIDIKDVGNGAEWYIPLNAGYGAQLSIVGKNSSRVLVNETGGFDSWIKQEGVAIWLEEYTHFNGNISLDYYNFGTQSNPRWVKPNVYPSPNTKVQDRGNTVVVEWNNVSLSKIANFGVLAYYIDPTFQPNPD